MNPNSSIETIKSDKRQICLSLACSILTWGTLTWYPSPFMAGTTTVAPSPMKSALAVEVVGVMMHLIPAPTAARRPTWGVQNKIDLGPLCI